VVEHGEGPVVLLIHGFPESWYSWRHQLPALADAGFRAVALDVRGYGRSLVPARVEAYRMLSLVADVVRVVQALGASTATIIGHDWGSPIAATSGLLRPDVFTAVGLLSVPYAPPGGPRPTDIFSRLGGDEQYYVSYFQTPGRAEREMTADARGWLRGFYTALSGETEPPAYESGTFFVPPGSTLADRFPKDARRPDWLTETDLDAYVADFERTGFTGALARYRNVDRDWEDLAAWEGAPLRQPSLFIAGDRDASTIWMAEAIAAYPTTLPGLAGSHVLEGCGHWAQQERPDEVNRLLVDWLLSLR
jgi:pimeloyl-ACP methyl ester carboxylesterase